MIKCNQINKWSLPILCNCPSGTLGHVIPPLYHSYSIDCTLNILCAALAQSYTGLTKSSPWREG